MPRLLVALPAAAQDASSRAAVRDSVQMSLSVRSYYKTTGSGGSLRSKCGAGIVMTWPNVVSQYLGREGRYSDYGRVATEGMCIPRGYGEQQTGPRSASSSRMARSATTPRSAAPATAPARGATRARIGRAEAGLGDNWDLLNGAPFRITDWYATFLVPDGTPIAAFALGPSFPNPARGAAMVPVELPAAGPVCLSVFDALGRQVAVAHDGPLGAGRHPLAVGAEGLPAGVYVVRLEASGEVWAQRLTVVR